RGEPRMRVAGEVAGGGVRLEGGEPGGGVHVALPAGLETVVRMHLRFRIVHPLDLMRAVAVEAFCRIGVAERGDLAVVGRAVRAIMCLMTSAAILQNGEPDGGRVGAFYAMSGVAVGADGGTRIGLLHDLLAVHRGEVEVLFRRVARSA